MRSYFLLGDNMRLPSVGQNAHYVGHAKRPLGVLPRDRLSFFSRSKNLLHSFRVGFRLFIFDQQFTIRVQHLHSCFERVVSNFCAILF